MFFTESSINLNFDKRIFVVDNFYADPHAVREFALKQEFKSDLRFYKGQRTNTQYFVPGTKQIFEQIIGQPITKWEEHGMCGVFQSCNAEDPIVYHVDYQQWAGMVYLTPNAPYDTGTSTYAHKKTGIRHQSEPGIEQCFEGGFYDGTKFELVDAIGNVFNRLVIFNGKCLHAPSRYFGKALQDARLFHMFFFD